jgi:hypothetical protein
MARKFATNIDLTLNQLLSTLFENLSGPPTNLESRVYYDTSLHAICVYNGTAWIQLGAGSAAATSGAEGVVQLAGDLAGTGSTAAAPTVGGLHLTADTAIGHKLTSVTDPGAAQDAATKHYVDAETTRATGAEALLAPLASPALTGTPTAPTKTALTNNTDVATTAYADAAVAVELSRAETAEGLLAPLASPTLTGTPLAPTKTPLTNSTALATTAYADLAVGVEASRAAAAEALKLALAGGTMSGAIAMGTSKITGLGDPSSAQDAATKNYVDGLIHGLSPKNSVDLATIAALSPANTDTAGVLTATGVGTLTVDGVLTTVGMRLLVKNEAAPAKNGIYTVTTAGAAGTAYVLTRSTDGNTWAELVGAFIGTTNEGGSLLDTVWLATISPGGTLETTSVTFTQIQSGTAVTGDSVFTTRSGVQILGLVAADVTSGTGPTAGATPLTLVSTGMGRVVKFAIKANASTLVYTLTHNLGTKQVAVIGQLDAGSAVPGAPIELDWAPGTTNTVVVTFPAITGQGANNVYTFVTVIG